MSNGKGQTPRKGYNHQKYAENYDQIFRKQKQPNQETKPMNRGIENYIGNETPTTPPWLKGTK